MTRSRVASLALLGVAAAAGVAVAQGFVNVRADLSGYNEVNTVSSAGTGAFRARIDDSNRQISWELSYEALEGSVLQSHIHFGAPATNGGISAFLCTNLPNVPAGTTVQACPAAPATISGVITPTDVIGPTVQGIAPGEFDALVAAIRSGAAYANVHSSLWTGGEIRGQIAPGHTGH